MFDVLYVILAILGLGLLVFIHELAHYFTAKKEGMKVEVFSIGFGKPIYSWMRKKVKWQIGILPFGGYVKIAGMERKKDEDLFSIKNGFFSKKPLQRIKVALAGPLSNIIFGFLAFALVWACGGRKQNFHLFTKKIGAVDTRSELYQKDIRPGDEILTYNKEPYREFKDLIFASLSQKDEMSISGNKIDYYRQLKKEPFSLEVKTYSMNAGQDKSFSTIGIKSPAGLFFYDAQNTFEKANSSLMQSGILDGDRLLWLNGEIIFSQLQLFDLLNEPSCFLTVKRNGGIFHGRFYKPLIEDLKITSYDAEEINDWRYETGLDKSLEKLYFLNYYFNKKGIVENRLSILDGELAEKVYGPDFATLQSGDKIVAVDGKKVSSAYDILKALQQNTALVIVQRNLDLSGIDAGNCDRYFDSAFVKANLLNVIQKIGVSEDGVSSADLHLLKPIQPITTARAFYNSDKKDWFKKELLKKKQSILKNPDAAKRKQELSLLEKQKNELRLGMALKEAEVRYNPGPVSLFSDTFAEIGKTIKALVTGQVHPKWMAGPLGIVQAIHKSWSVSILEAFYWLGFISLNLGLVNLLPLPVLDGGYILFSLWEMITKKPLKAKTMERLILPFVILLILFFIYMTYNDILRLIKSFF